LPELPKLPESPELIGAEISTAATPQLRPACRSKSPDDFVAKIGTVCEESDETQFWFDLTLAASVAHLPELKALFAESTELVSIFTASWTTAKANQMKRRAARGTALLVVLIILAAAAALR
jgi:hypothetical protein